MSTLTLTRAQSFQGPLILVNPTHPLRGETRPNLVPVDPGEPDILMERQAALLLSACIRSVGGTGQIVLVSGWRSQEEQEAIWTDSMAREGEAFTRQYVALPGCSEHQTGLAIDLALAAPQIDFIRPHFPQEGVCGAFRRAAASYGFLQRYRKEKEELTTIAEEPWHFRYVGVPHAALMEENGLCLEEYGAWVRQGPRSQKGKDGKQATVSYVACPGERVELTRPKGCYQISGDNAGGFFLTVWGDLL